jgi:hypothetical protein
MPAASALSVVNWHEYPIEDLDSQSIQRVIAAERLPALAAEAASLAPQARWHVIKLKCVSQKETERGYQICKGADALPRSA